MPTYEYACKDCGHGLEVVQKFSDDPLTVCPNCSGSLRKVLHAPGISFKGSGFYKNDSRPSSSSSNPLPTGDAAPAKDAGAGAASSDKGETAKPAPNEPAKPKDPAPAAAKNKTSE